MPINVNQNLNTNKPIEDDIFDNGKDGSTPSLASASIVASATEGQAQTTVAADGDLRLVDTDQDALDFDPTTHLDGNATQRLSIAFLLRALYRLLKVVANRIPVLSGGKIPVETGAITANLGTIGNVATQETLVIVSQLLEGTLTVDGSGTIQPVSVGSLPLPTGAATETTLATRASQGTVAAIQSLLQGTLAVSANTLPLPTGAATDDTLQEVRDRLSQTTDAPATSNTGAGSPLAFIKRITAHLLAPRLYVATAIATSGDNLIITTPVAGSRIVITKIRIQGTSGIATSVLLKNGSIVIARLRTTQDGSGLSEVYGFSDAIRLSAASAFILNLSAANAHSVSLEYYLESTSTGLPL